MAGFAPMVMTRAARESDAEAIAAIYNQGIEDRVATFETEPRSADDIRAALADRGDRYPTVVLERDGTVIAVAWVSAYRPRRCYEGIAEFSVYTAREARGSGAGSRVLGALLQECEQRGFWKVLSRIFPENTASLALHQRAGFRVVGTRDRPGRHHGKWRDVVLIERRSPAIT